MVLLRIYPHIGPNDEPRDEDDFEGQGVLAGLPGRIIGELLDVPAAGVAKKLRAVLGPLSLLEAVWNRPVDGIGTPPDVD